jgi:hypothetical protein
VTRPRLACQAHKQVLNGRSAVAVHQSCPRSSPGLRGGASRRRGHAGRGPHPLAVLVAVRLLPRVRHRSTASCAARRASASAWGRGSRSSSKARCSLASAAVTSGALRSTSYPNHWSPPGLRPSRGRGHPRRSAPRCAGAGTPNAGSWPGRWPLPTGSAASATVRSLGSVSVAVLSAVRLASRAVCPGR